MAAPQLPPKKEQYKGIIRMQLGENAVVCCQELSHEVKLYSSYAVCVIFRWSLQPCTALAVMSALRARVFSFPFRRVEREFSAVQTLMKLYLLTCQKASVVLHWAVIT